MAIAVHWQDADSSSEKAVKKLHPDAKVMNEMPGSCWQGPQQPAQVISIEEVGDQWVGFINRHKGKYPDIAILKCCCQGKNHKKGCGCMSDDFVQQARINHYIAAKQADNDPGKYAATLRELGNHHCKNEHTWDGEHCSFHPKRQCSCCILWEVQGQDEHYMRRKPVPQQTPPYMSTSHLPVQNRDGRESAGC